MPRWCSSTPTASTRCRCARRRSSGTCTRPPGRARHLHRPEAPPRAGDASAARGDRRPTRRASTPATLAEIQRYTKLFWINNGPYNNLTARKFVLSSRPRPSRRREERRASAAPRSRCPRGESLDALLARLQPMFFDPTVDPIVTNKAPGPGKDILTGQREQPVLRRVVSEAEAFKKAVREKYGLNSRLVKQDGKLVEEVYRVGGRYSKEITADRHAPRGRDSLRHRADGQCAARADPVVPDRRGRRPREVRHRLGGGQGVAGRHHQRLHRGLPRSARHQGRLGGPGLLREPGEDRAHPEARRQRAVVRGPHAVRPEVPQAERQGHRGQRHRRGHRDRRLGPGDADRHQPAERSAHPRSSTAASRCRCRNVTEAYDKSTPGVDARRVLVDAGGSRARSEVRHARGRTAHRHARGDRPRVGPAGRTASRARRRTPSRSTSRRSRKAAPTWSGSTSSPTRSWSSSASCRPPTRTPSSAPSTRATRATRSCSCAASARARRSRKTTCATARWSCGG